VGVAAAAFLDLVRLGSGSAASVIRTTFRVTCPALPVAPAGMRGRRRHGRGQVGRRPDRRSHRPRVSLGPLRKALPRSLGRGRPPTPVSAPGAVARVLVGRVVGEHDRRRGRGPDRKAEGPAQARALPVVPPLGQRRAARQVRAVARTTPYSFHRRAPAGTVRQLLALPHRPHLPVMCRLPWRPVPRLRGSGSPMTRRRPVSRAACWYSWESPF
jgi:hypothetical protein